MTHTPAEMREMPKPGQWWKSGYSSIVGLPIMCQPDPTKNSDMVASISPSVPRAKALELADQIVALANGDAVLLPRRVTERILAALSSRYTVYGGKPVSEAEGRFFALLDVLATTPKDPP